MLSDLFSASPLIVAITIITAGLVYGRAEQLGAVTSVSGSNAFSRNSLVSSYMIAGLLFGAAAVEVYRLALGRYGAEGGSVFLKMGIGAAILLSILAVAVMPRMKRGGTAEYIALNLLWGLGYGGLLPLILG